MNHLQKNKIEKQLSFFQKLDYELTECKEWDITKGRFYFYVLTKGNVDIQCDYVLLHSDRITSRFRIFNNAEGIYLGEEYKTYNDFLKIF